MPLAGTGAGDELLGALSKVTDTPILAITDGINVCMGDGSVRFLRQSTSAVTLAALVTRDAGDIVTGDN